MSLSLKEGDWPKLSQILRRIINKTDFFCPRRISQASQPTIAEGELAIWHDSDAGKVYLLYNDAAEGAHKVELA